MTKVNLETETGVINITFGKEGAKFSYSLKYFYNALLAINDYVYQDTKEGLKLVCPLREFVAFPDCDNLFATYKTEWIHNTMCRVLFHVYRCDDNGITEVEPSDYLTDEDATFVFIDRIPYTKEHEDKLYAGKMVKRDFIFDGKIGDYEIFCIPRTILKKNTETQEWKILSSHASRFDKGLYGFDKMIYQLYNGSLVEISPYYSNGEVRFDKESKILSIEYPLKDYDQGVDLTSWSHYRPGENGLYEEFKR